MDVNCNMTCAGRHTTVRRQFSFHQYAKCKAAAFRTSATSFFFNLTPAL